MDASSGLSRGELLEWINTTLNMHLHKIEETASGAVACQIIDMLYPDTVPLQRVNFVAKDAYEYTKNYKILQSACLKNGIQKNIDVDRLIKGRPQDNLEFMQWLKQYFDKHRPNREYNAVERRAAAKGGRGSASRRALTSEVTASSVLQPPAARLSKDSSRSTSPSRVGDNLACPSKKPRVSVFVPPVNTSRGEQEEQLQELAKKVSEKEGVIVTQTLTVGVARVTEMQIKNLEAERDFYKKKLVDIEELVTKEKENGELTVAQLAERVTAIL
ncbi:hypothetical protein BLSTO_00600 [Blastocystis sp. subtype 1]